MADRGAFDDVVEAAAVLVDISDVARAEVWGSSALSVWREQPDAAAIDGELVEWLIESGDERAALVLLSISDVLGLSPSVRAEAVSRLGSPPPWVHHVASAVPTRAWQVRDRLGRSVGLGFVHGDGSELSLLAEIDRDTGLAALIAAPGPDELFAEAEDLVAPEAMDVSEAAGAIVQAWRLLLGSDRATPETVIVNQMIAVRRLSSILGEDLSDLGTVSPGAAEADEVDPVERAELDSWALSTLRSALGGVSPDETLAADDLLDPFYSERRSLYPAEERDAFAALEWADWLGAVIGLTRGGVGTDASASAIVDHINRCPEVTSTIPRRDRPFYEWAWQHVVVMWQRRGLVGADRCLTELGHRVLPRLLATAWSRPASADPAE